MNDNEQNDSSKGEQVAASSTAFLQWRGVMVVGMCLILSAVTVEVEGQTASSSPVPPIATGVAQTSPAPKAEPAAESNTTTQERLDSEKPAVDQSEVFVFKTQVREVILHATVVDEQRRLVTNLERAAFTAFENGVPQATTSFHRDDVPVALGIVIDNSGSMREKREKVNQAVLNLIRSSGPNDETFVVNFNQNSYLDQDYTSDVN